MKKLALTIYFCLATLFVAYGQTDKKISEFPQKFRLSLSDRFVIISTNTPSAFYTNYTISGQNLLDSFGGVITNNTAAISNSVTANLTNLLSVTVVTNYLDTDGDSISFESGGTFANSTQAKALYVRLGATILGQITNILFTTGTTNGFSINGTIVRKGAESYVSTVNFIPSSLHAFNGGTTNYTYSTTVRGVESLATNNTLAIGTLAISAGDVTNEYLRVYNYPTMIP